MLNKEGGSSWPLLAVPSLLNLSAATSIGLGTLKTHPHLFTLGSVCGPDVPGVLFKLASAICLHGLLWLQIPEVQSLLFKHYNFVCFDPLFHWFQ